MNGVVCFAAGDHSVEPFVVESGEAREVKISLGAGEKRSVTAFVLGSEPAAARLSLTVDLTGPGAEFHLDALFVASDGGATAGGATANGTGRPNTAGEAAIDVRINHLAPECVSRQLVKGIAAGSATGSFTGMVHVAPGAQKTDASQRNQNIQLADSAHIITQPQLEIYADDVRCGHGATVGRLDEAAIFYMRQRGVGEAEARRMQLHGFAAEIVDRVASEAFCEPIRTKIATLIDTL